PGSDTRAPDTIFLRVNGMTCNAVTGGSITCTVSSLANGASATLTLTVRVNDTTPFGTTVTNTAKVSTAVATDTNPANDVARAPTDILAPRADLRITKASVPANTSPAPGGELTYTITATNGGPSIATSTVVSDSVPAGTSFVRLSQGTGCSSPPVGGGGDLTCTIASLASGASTTVVFVVKTPSSTPAGT